MSLAIGRMTEIGRVGFGPARRVVRALQGVMQTTRRVAHLGHCLRDQGCAEFHHAGGAVMKRPVKERAED